MHSYAADRFTLPHREIRAFESTAVIRSIKCPIPPPPMYPLVTVYNFKKMAFIFVLGGIFRARGLPPSQQSHCQKRSLFRLFRV